MTTLTANASGGTATFGVPLSPDGTYQVVATCRNANGVTGTSGLTSFPVDTTAPNLTVTQPTDGQFFGPTDARRQGRFNVCGQTTSTDAAGLPASLGAARQQPVRRAGRLRDAASAPAPSPRSTPTRAFP